MEKLYIKYQAQGAMKTIGPVDRLRAKTELMNLSHFGIEAIVYDDHCKAVGVSIKTETGMTCHFQE